MKARGLRGRVVQNRKRPAMRVGAFDRQMAAMLRWAEHVSSRRNSENLQNLSNSCNGDNVALIHKIERW